MMNNKQLNSNANQKVMLMKKFTLGLLFSATALLCSPLQAMPAVPDYYQEPGLSEGREYQIGQSGEHIDPFSGTLRLSQTDISIPGNGGLDINVTRVYHSIQAVPTGPRYGSYLKGNNLFGGTGWDMHFGRVFYNDNPIIGQQLDTNGNAAGSIRLTLGSLHPTGGATARGGCDVNRSRADYNPVFEMADGSRMIFYDAPAGSTYDFVSKERWTATCVKGTHNEGSTVYIDGGLEITDTQGTIYTIDRYGRIRGNLTVTEDPKEYQAWHVTKIEDVNGNTLTFNYRDRSITQFTLLQNIDASDGRVVNFSYTDPTTATPKLSSVDANGRTWNYIYEPHGEFANTYAYLKEVRGPEGLVWQYDYFTSALCSSLNNTVGLYSIRKVTNPWGGESRYWYQQVDFGDPGVLDGTNTAIKTKTTYGPGVIPGEWFYRFFKLASDDFDHTEIVTPTRREVYQHCGRKAIQRSEAACDKLFGVIVQKDTYPGKNNEGVSVGGSANRLQRETYQWDRVQISAQIEGRPDRQLADWPGIYKTRLTQSSIIRDGQTYTSTQSNFDVFDNPQITTAKNGSDTQTVNLAYQNILAKNIQGLVTSERLADDIPNLAAIRSYDGNGLLQQETANGIATNYAYHPTGDLFTVTDALNRVTRYENYYRGTARKETRTDGVILNTTVNNTGTIDSVTNGEGNTTSFAYDQLERITGINTARTDDSDITINRSFNSLTRTLTRGNFIAGVEHDAFGRVLKTDTDGIVTTSFYDAEGRATFQTYPNSTDGITTRYDGLSRALSSSHSVDGATSKIEYLSNNQIRTTDANGNITTQTYRRYSGPDGGQLMRIDAPEGVSTVFTRSTSGLVRSIAQSGMTRGYIYNNQYQLTNEVHPETGTTSYQYDALGRQETRQITGQGITTYGYDNLDRITLMDYPVGTPDTTSIYDRNSNLKQIAHDNNVWDYTYDKNDNLKTEKLTIGSGASQKVYNLGYIYNDKDAMGSRTGPNGFVVNYAPDPKGWPTTLLSPAANFVSQIDYYANGQTKLMNYGNGHTVNIGQTNRLFTGRISSAGILDYDPTYDRLGNLRKRTDNITANRNLEMGYDGLNRLTTAVGPWNVGTIAYNTRSDITNKRIGTEQIAYSYSATKNQLSTTSQTNAADASIPAVNKSYGYDAEGNMTGDGDFVYQYNIANELMQITNPADASFNMIHSYDGHGRRVVQTETDASGSKTTITVYSQAGQLVYEEQGTDSSQYLNAGGMLVAKYKVDSTDPANPVGKTTWLYPDHLGSPTVATDATGAVQWREIYAPYGKRLLKENAADDQHAFYTGHLEDSATGLTYMQARYYHPTIGRFMGVDPVPFQEGSVQTFNRYAYANNNPYGFVDPDGEATKAVGLVVKVLDNGTKIAIRKIRSIKEAVRIRRGGGNVDMGTRRQATQVERSLNNGNKSKISRHSGSKGHNVRKTGKPADPHFQTDGLRGHTFWGKLSVAGTTGGLALTGVPSRSEASMRAIPWQDTQSLQFLGSDFAENSGMAGRMMGQAFDDLLNPIGVVQAFKDFSTTIRFMFKEEKRSIFEKDR